MSRPYIAYERLAVVSGRVARTQNPNFQIRPPDKLKVDWFWFDTDVPPMQNWFNFLIKPRRLSRRDFTPRRLAIPAWHNVPREFSPWAWQMLLREPYRVGAHESFLVTIVNPTLDPLDFVMGFHCVGMESGDERTLSLPIQIAAAPAAGQFTRQQFGDRDAANDGIEPLLLQKVSVQPATLLPPRQVLMQIKPSDDVAWTDDVIPMLAYFPDVGPYGHFYKPHGEILLENNDGIEFEVENVGTPNDPQFCHIAMAGHIVTEATSVSGGQG